MFLESISSSSETNLTYVSQNDDNDRPTAIETATHAIPPTDTTSVNNENESQSENLPSPTSTEPILPVISSSLDESTERVIQTNEPSTSNDSQEENSQQTEQTTPSTNSEYVNPRGIRFTTSPTPSSSTTSHVKGCY